MSEQNDHDLLVTLLESVRQLKDEIINLKDNTKAQISDHENRIRTLESTKWKTAGVTALAVLLATLFVTYFAGSHLSFN